MPGLLDMLQNPDPATRQGLLQMGLALMQSKGNFMSSVGQAGTQGLLGAQQFKQQQFQNTVQQQQLADMKRKQQEQAQQDAFRQSLLSPSMQVSQDAMSGGSGPTMQAAAGMKPVDPQQGLMFDAMKSGMMSPLDYLKLQQKDKPKIKDYKEVRNADGSVSIVGFDEYGKPVQTGQTPFMKPERADFGGYLANIDPISGKQTRLGDKTVTPGDLLQSQTTMRGQNMVDARSRETNSFAVSKPFEVTDPTTGQLLLVRQDKHGGIAPVPGFQPKGMGTTKLTEDQGKATGWLAQATNAYGNMQSAIENNPGAAKPGLNDALAAIPSFGVTGALANKLRGSERQKYMQASSSLSEALLRAATGAGINMHEAEQKVRELTPQFGDGDAVVKQKMDAIPVYLESLKVRAGPGAKQLPGIMDRAKPISGDGGGWSITPVP